MDFKCRDYLFSKDDWCDIRDIEGEENVLNSTLIQEAFEKILDDYNPKYKYAIFSLCTSTRPYLKSRKWSMYYKCFGKSCELIICSNGGIIPIEYMNCFPFLEYDAPHTKEFTPQYKRLFVNRLNKFLDKFSFEKIIFIFTPNSRNYEALLEFPLPDNSILIPSLKMYENIKKGIDDRYIGVSRTRDILCCDTILSYIKRFFCIESNYLDILYEKYPNSPKPSMDSLFNKMLKTLEVDKGYSLEQLISKIISLNPIYSRVYISKTIKGHTKNIESEFNKEDNLVYVDGLYYLLNSDKKKDKHKKLF
jgi:hypothetical protein